jgi:predicted ATPase/serine/threonine protein kinase/Tfp pilus assembly protein PilF
VSGSAEAICPALVYTPRMALPRVDQLTAADLPRRFGRYELRSILGEGGMARVFGAELFGPAGFRKPVAVKVIKSKVLDQTGSDGADAFIREARLGGLLKHPNIVDVYELGEAEGQLFISMEWVKGLTLSALIHSGRLPSTVVLEIAVGIVAGLASAHSLCSAGLEAGLVHRDLKPSNVLVSWDGAVKVVDFGIATTRHGELSESGEIFSQGRGTPSYMSPEQILGESIDGRSDLFSLGLVLTELSIGRFLPRKAVGPVVDDVHLAEVEAVIPGLRHILLRCLQPLPEARYPAADALLADLETLRERVGLQYRLRTWLSSAFVLSPSQGAASSAGSPQRAGMGILWDDRDSKASAVLGACTKVLKPMLDSEANTTILKPKARRRTNLGLPRDAYVGRASELDALSKHFETGTRLVTLKGTGGAGKTRFAQRYARSQVNDLAGGAWFVDLTEARTSKGLVQATAMALEVRMGSEGHDGMVTQLGHAISGRGPVLLVLDNFEQVVEHAAGTLGQWLEMAPEARFLVTSREPLQLSGEHIFPLEPLPETDGIELLKLRARSAGANWQETSQTRAAIVGIVKELDGLPLAIELAAARTRLLSPTQLLERLSQRFKLLRGGRRDQSNRQSSLRDLIDWSWEMLEPWEQSALAQLSVFRDGFFMEAAEDVLDLSAWPDAPWSLDVVGSLLDKSLLYSREVHGQPRFGMYVSIQKYAAEKLGAEFGATAARHGQHFAQFGEEAFLETLDSHGGVARRRSLVSELENFLAGVNGALAAGEPEVAANCALAAGELFEMHGPYSDGIALIERVSGQPVGRGTQGRLLGRAGRLLYLAGRYSEALEYFQQALAITREIGDAVNEAINLGNLAIFHQEQGRISEAVEHFQQALAITREVGDRRNETTNLRNLATLHQHQGRYSEALEHIQQALAIAREIGSRRNEGLTLGNLATFHQEQGRYSEALGHFQQALSIAREVGNRRNEGIILGHLATFHQEQGRISEAVEHFQQALAIACEVGHRRTEGIVLGNLGDLLFSQGDLLSAETHLLPAITIGDETMLVAAGAFRGSLALIRAQQGAFDEARTLLEKGESQIRGGHLLELGKFLRKKAEVEHLAGEPAAAAVTLAEAESIDVELNATS